MDCPPNQFFQAPSQRSPYPQLSISPPSYAASTSQSSSSLSSMSPQMDYSPPQQPTVTIPSNSSSSAPLPSPTATHTNRAQYFSALDAQSQRIMPLNLGRPAVAPANNSMQFMSSNAPNMTANGFASTVQQSPPQYNQSEALQLSQMPRQDQNQFIGMQGGVNAGNAPETAPFLRDFSLVAEAAKRAQMAVLMRDVEGMELS